MYLYPFSAAGYYRQDCCPYDDRAIARNLM
jgi:hypothetical protein